MYSCISYFWSSIDAVLYKHLHVHIIQSPDWPVKSGLVASSTTVTLIQTRFNFHLVFNQTPITMHEINKKNNK